MKTSLASGLSHEKTITVTPQMGVSHLGDGPGVFSTPAMIGLIEQTCLEAMNPHLDDREQSVGTMVHVWHRAAVSIGEQVTCRIKMVGQERRKSLFEVQVNHGDVRIGDGTHERFVINLDKFKGG